MPTDRSFELRNRYVGRVGALAVALGVGMAVATSPGIAHAETGDADTPSAAEDDTPTPEDREDVEETDLDDGDPDEEVDEPQPEEEPQPEDDPEVEAPDEDDEPTDGDDAEPPLDTEPTDPSEPVDGINGPAPGSDTSGPDFSETNNETNNEPPADHTPPDGTPETTIVADQTSNRVAAELNSDAAPLSMAPELQLQAFEPIAPPPARPAAERLEDAVIDVASVFVTAALAPFVVFNPLAPQAPQSLWLALLWVRRELQRAVDDANPTATVDQTTVTEIAATDTEFTGQPSLINQGFVAVLRAIKPVLNALGISLNGSTASIPFFTDGKPPFFLLAGVDAGTEQYQFDDGTTWTVWTLTPSNEQQRTDDVVIALHGGSFITTASLFHWWTYTDMVRDTGATVIVPMYPLANEAGTGGTAATVVPKATELYFDLSEQYGGENVSVIGDSAGGAIALAAMQQAVAQCSADPACDPETDLPGHLVLFAPVLDAGLTNPNVGLVDDPILNADDSRRNGALWAGDLPITDPLVSPIYGSMEGLPPTTVYAGSYDLRAPDVLVLQQIAAATPGSDFTFELRRGQVHDWLIFAFLPDAREIRPSVYDALGLSD